MEGMPRITNHPTNEKLVKKANLTLPLPLAWISRKMLDQ
jgi:hypothetical protein